MNNKINQYQKRLFNKLFATLPSVRRANEFNNGSDLNVEIKEFYYFKNMDFWFTRAETEDKYLFLFGIRDKPIKNINGNDTCLIIDFDKDIQFNDTCLGLFSVKNGEIHILINYAILKERYPYIKVTNLKVTGIKSFDDSLELGVIDLGNLYEGCIDNLEKLIKAGFIVKSQKDKTFQNVKKDSDVCKICSKKKSDFKLDSRLKNLKDLKPEFCGKCIEKIVVSEFFTKISPLLKGNNVSEIKRVKEKFGNDHLFDIGMDLLEKYEIIQFIGVKKLYYTVDRDSYLVKKFIKYSDKNNLLIDEFTQNNGSKSDNHVIELGLSEKTIEDDVSFEITKEQMEIILEAIGNGKSRKEAAILANIPESEISDLYNVGMQENNPEFVSFFRRLLEIENINKAKNKEFNKIKLVLNELKRGKSISQINISNENEADVWVEKGKQNEWPYDYFYEQYRKIIENEIVAYKIKEINREIFLKNILAGNSKEKSAENAGSDLSLFENWYLKGSEGIEPFVEFYNDYLDAEKNKKQILRVAKTDAMGNYKIISQMNTILEDLENGKSEDEAIAHANVSKKTYEYWLNRGKQEFGDLYIQFYQHVNRIKYEFHDDEEHLEEVPENRLIDPNIYAPLSEEYEESFSSMNQSGIAWVNQVGNKLYYMKSVDGKSVRLSGENVYELFNEVKKSKQIWGIRDYSKASQYIDFPDDFEIPVRPQIEEEVDGYIRVDLGIYAPLPEEYEESFSSMNQSGIAWVNQVGNKLYYMKSVDGKSVRLSGENVYELFNEVKKSNQIWGIRDYSKASQYIDFPDDFEIPVKPQADVDVPIEIGPDIYAPLPEEYENLFSSSMNQSGIAWVSRIGNRWVYAKKINGKTKQVADEDIYELYRKVKNENQIWGIRDYDRAKKLIDIPDDFEIPVRPQIEEDFDVPIEIDPDIYTPLSKEYELQFNLNQANKTGIAWVNKVGKKWIYSRTINGEKIYFNASNIYKLHKQVKDANQIWGIKDYDKARKIIDIPEDYVVPENQDEPIEISSDILAPLPERYLASFNPNQKNKTGIAWVNQIGKRWVYKRRVNGEDIKFSEYDIHKLHETVIGNNQVWGITDFDKARPIIDSNQINEPEPKPPITTKPINSSKVTVNYIEKSINDIDVIIRGVIRNNDLIDVLNRLKLFEKNIKRIITTSINNDVDIFIELEINKYLKNSFKEKIDDLEWNVNE